MRTLKLLSIVLLIAIALSACAPAATPTAAPAPTEAPKPTEAPAATEAPKATEAPAATEAPKATEAVAPAGGELKVAILAPLSGPVPTFGVSTRDGALLAIKEWNAKGGVLGMKIVPIVEDSQCTPDPAVNAANKVIEQDKVSYIIGEVCSKASIPVSEIANAKKVVQISPTSTNTGVTVDNNGKTKEFIYRACFIDPFQGQVGAKFALLNLKAKTAFIMVDQSNDYVKGLAQAFDENFTKGGGKIVGTENYTGTDTDFSAILSKIAAAKPDMVYLPDYYNVVNLATKQAKEKGINVPFMGGDGWDSPDLDLKSAAGGFFTNHYSPEDPRPEVQNFLKAYGTDYQDDKGAAKVPDALAALAYDATNLLLTAIQNAGADDTTKVTAALNSINFQGVSGNITFDASHNPIKSATILAVKPEGVKFEAVVNP
jgi:branched-chain amino acid transport system substrate-binding protein